MPTAAPIIGIVRHSINVDGEGVCTLVAFHSCTLKCKYCLNPQSLTEVEKYKKFTPEALLEKVKVDDLYFQATNGGITFGGGEPMLRAEFIEEFKRICPSNWRISIETAMNVEQSFVQRLLDVIDHYYIDIKDINNTIYKSYTGKSNHHVIENLKFLAQHGLADKITIRVPLIPGFNTADDQEKSIAYLKELGFKNFNKFTYITDTERAG